MEGYDDRKDVGGSQTTVHRRYSFAPFPSKFKMPQMESYDRHEDPAQHLKTFRLFVNQFFKARHPKKPVTHLLSIKQNEKETLNEYIARFNLKAVQVEGYSDDVAFIAMMTRLQARRFLWSIMKNPPRTYIELLNNAYKYTNARTLQCEKK
ncbi:hypothetical protein LWI29_012795 [Acer saccharum]|uniref:Retrotransposon gag domain-containing protein n=1 Tax=Acer saccharum TaxID=4024 RepID=A0AA39V983_ACESA|nr:hypothetical protein LWI29_012795 [Acer saccharum]